MGDAINGDRVIVHIDDNDNAKGHRQGHITKVLERGNKVMSVLYIRKKIDIFMCVPITEKYIQKLL